MPPGRVADFHRPEDTERHRRGPRPRPRGLSRFRDVADRRTFSMTATLPPPTPARSRPHARPAAPTSSWPSSGGRPANVKYSRHRRGRRGSGAPRPASVPGSARRCVEDGVRQGSRTAQRPATSTVSTTIPGAQSGASAETSLRCDASARPRSPSIGSLPRTPRRSPRGGVDDGDVGFVEDDSRHVVLHAEVPG